MSLAVSSRAPDRIPTHMLSAPSPDRLGKGASFALRILGSPPPTVRARLPLGIRQLSTRTSAAALYTIIYMHLPHLKKQRKKKKRQTAMSRGEASKSHQAMGRPKAAAAAAQPRAPGAPAPPPSAPRLSPGLTEDGEFVDIELGDQQRRRPSAVAPRPEPRPSGGQRGSRGRDRCCLAMVAVLLFVVVLVGVAVVAGFGFLAVIGFNHLLVHGCR
jgi:hypothetical protein